MMLPIIFSIPIMNKIVVKMRKPKDISKEYISIKLNSNF